MHVNLCGRRLYSTLERSTHTRSQEDDNPIRKKEITSSPEALVIDSLGSATELLPYWIHN